MTASTGYGPRMRLIFDGDERKYELWEVKFLGFMRLQKLHNVFVSEENPDVEKNAEAFAELIQCLDDRSLSLVIRDAKDNGKKALEILREHYLGKSKPKIISLYTELTTLSKFEGETVTDYMLRAEAAASSLKAAGEVVSDSLLIAVVLKGLPIAFKTFCTVTTQKDKEHTFAEFKVALRSFEETEKQNDSHGGGDAVMVNEVKPIQCVTCSKYGHKSFQCKTRKSGQNPIEKTHSKKWCGICKCTSHNTQQCRKNKNSAKSVTENEMVEAQINSFHKVSECQSVGQDSLLVDCGATTHILTDK